MNFEELKKTCDDKIKGFPQYEKKYKTEISKAKIAYENNIDLYEDFVKNKEKISNRYIIPFLLGFTNKVIDMPIELKQAKVGSGGGLDIDVDFSSAGKEIVTKHLKEKYGEDRIISVGTYSSLGQASAIKDILKREGVEYSQANLFCSFIDSELKFEENIENFRQNNKTAYEIYLKHKNALDYVPKILKKIRSVGRHAGGILILPSPVYEHIPVERVQGELVSAFVESGSSTILDELGYVKYDILAITVLDVIDNAIDMIEEDIYLIEDDDGIVKAVPASYLSLGEEVDNKD